MVLFFLQYKDLWGEKEEERHPKSTSQPGGESLLMAMAEDGTTLRAR